MASFWVDQEWDAVQIGLLCYACAQASELVMVRKLQR